jgi:hypothetical protein
MIYQLAKTSPLITGQVKMNMIMNGNKVVDIQYVPLSNYIPFAYNNPIDVLNYTHGENVKSLYNKIPEQFFKEVQNPKLNQKQLHRYDTLRDETRDFSYEMGMRRMEYQRYNKQFEFFCPFWCNDTADFDKLKFVINIKNVLPNNPKKERIVFSKVIEFDDKVKQYLKNIYPSLGIQGKNSDIVYINFNEMQSHIKGLNVINGNIQTVDTSYIVNNLLMQERPLLETDNMIISLFGSNKIISSQFFNFSFVFNVEDFLPINFIKSFISERINIYVDMYLEDKISKIEINDFSEENNIEKIITSKVDVKDLYTNYEFIPKYDIYKGKYYTEQDGYNALDYLKDNTCVELINKNKLTQSTFHWVLQNNQSSIFNLYNGFSPLYKGKELSTAISNDAPDMFVDIFDINKNPYGVFKYTNFYSNDTEVNSLIKLIEDENTYHTIDFIGDKIENEYQFFGNILINNLNLKDVEHKNINKIKTAIIRLNETFIKQKLDDILKGFNFNIVNIKLDENTNSNTLIIYTNDLKKSNNEFTFIFVIYSKDESNTKLTSFFGIYNFYYDDNKYTSKFEKDAYKGLSLIANILRCSKLPNCICFDKSFSTKHVNSPSISSKENEMVKTDKFSEIYRYDSNIVPMFIDLKEDSVFSNNIYFCKQYNRDILNTIKSIDAGIQDIDGIKTYSKYALTKFTPVYKSLGYYVLNSKKINYEKYYRDVMFNVHTTQEDGKENFYKDGCNCYCKDVSWYKNNAMIYLPTNFTVLIIKNTGDSINDEDIIKCIFDKVINETEGIYISDDDKKYGYDLVKYYIKDLYSYKYKYDYVDEYIKQQKYEIKFTLK